MARQQLTRFTRVLATTMLGLGVAAAPALALPKSRRVPPAAEQDPVGAEATLRALGSRWRTYPTQDAPPEAMPMPAPIPTAARGDKATAIADSAPTEAVIPATAETPAEQGPEQLEPRSLPLHPILSDISLGSANSPTSAMPPTAAKQTAAAQPTTAKPATTKPTAAKQPLPAVTDPADAPPMPLMPSAAADLSPRSSTTTAAPSISAAPALPAKQPAPPLARDLIDALEDAAPTMTTTPLRMSPSSNSAAMPLKPAPPPKLPPDKHAQQPQPADGDVVYLTDEDVRPVAHWTATSPPLSAGVSSGNPLRQGEPGALPQSMPVNPLRR